MITKDKTFKKRKLIRWRSKKLNLSKNDVLIELISLSKDIVIISEPSIYYYL